MHHYRQEALNKSKGISTNNIAVSIYVHVQQQRCLGFISLYKVCMRVYYRHTFKSVQNQQVASRLIDETGGLTQNTWRNILGVSIASYGY